MSANLINFAQLTVFPNFIAILKPSVSKLNATSIKLSEPVPLASYFCMTLRRFAPQH